MINTDLKNSQFPITNDFLSKAIVDAKTGITAIDKSILKLYDIGYMHNHLRMYVASIACNIAQSHWMFPAKWMYYYLLDADWASKFPQLAVGCWPNLTKNISTINKHKQILFYQSNRYFSGC